MMSQDEANHRTEDNGEMIINLEEISSEFKLMNEGRRVLSPLPANLEIPSESIRRTINGFNSNSNEEKLENVENYEVDFDYLNSLSDLPNVEPIKRLTRNYSTASSASNSKYLFHWMNYSQEHNYIEDVTPSMESKLLKHFSIEPSLKPDRKQQLERLFEYSKDLLKKKEIVQEQELVHTLITDEERGDVTNIKQQERVDFSSQDSDSEEEPENLYMIDDNYEIGGLDSVQDELTPIVSNNQENRIETLSEQTRIIPPLEPTERESVPLKIVTEQNTPNKEVISSQPIFQTIITETKPVEEKDMNQIIEHNPLIPLLARTKPPPTPLVFNLKTQQTIQPIVAEKVEESNSKKRKRKKKEKKKENTAEESNPIIDSYTPSQQPQSQQPNSNSSKSQKNKKEKKQKKKPLQPEKNPLFHLGKVSSLDENDQDIYMKGLKQFKLFQNQNALSKQVSPPSAYFFKLKKVVEEEQAAFRKALFDDAWNNRQTRYFFIDPYISDQVDKMKKKRKFERILPTNATSLENTGALPRHFELWQTLGIAQLQQTKQALGNSFADPILRFSKLIYQTTDKYFQFHRNQILYQAQDEDVASADEDNNEESETQTPSKPVKLPKFPIGTNVYQVNDPSLNPNNLEDQTQELIVPPTENVYNPFEESKKKSTPTANLYHHRILPNVSEDPIILQSILPQCTDIDFVCASSALTAMINTLGPTFSEEWCLPVIAKPKSDESQFTVFIDKPMIKKAWTLRDNNQIYYKYTIKTLALKEPLIHIPCNPLISKAEYNENDSYSQYELLHRDGEPITYNLFTLANLKLLIRTKLDGANMDVKTDRPTAIKLMTKLEYQTEKGLELSTQSELAKWWSVVFMRPASAAVLTRVDVAQNRVCRTEFKRIKDILPSNEDEEEENERYWSNMLTSNLSSLAVLGGSNIGFQPQLSVQMVYGILTEVTKLITLFQKSNLKDYRFLIQKMPNESLVHLLVEYRKSTPDHIPRGLPQKFYYDLHSDYEKHGAITETQIMPYIPLMWKINGQIPYTFPIRPSTTTTTSSSASNKKKHNDKKKRKKK